MKRILFLSSVFFSFILFSGCGTTRMTEAEQAAFWSKIDSRDYVFDAAMAQPSGYKSIPLSYGYSLSVKPDTVVAFLPYFGVAYSAPMFSTDSGIKFTSTQFEYKVTKKGKAEEVKIVTKDTNRNIELLLTIHESGSATLSVYDPTRRHISFNGKVE